MKSIRQKDVDRKEWMKNDRNLNNKKPLIIIIFLYISPKINIVQKITTLNYFFYNTTSHYLKNASLLYFSW